MGRDRRTQYTKALLRECLVTLLREKSIQQVTVSALCRMADINRSTYYAHYANPIDQLEKLETELLDNLSHIMAQGTGQKPDLDVITEICQYYWDNRDLFLLLDDSNTGPNFNQKEVEALKQGVFSTWEKQNYQYTGLEREYAYTYIIAGTNGVLHKWLSEDPSPFTPAEMSALLQKFNNYGLRGK